MQKHIELWASDPVARDTTQFDACCSEWQWCKVHSRVQFAAFPLQSPTKPECSICLQNEKLVMMPRDLSLLDARTWSINSFRDTWLASREACTEFKPKGKDADKLLATHKLKCNERIAWAEYTDACLLTGALLRKSQPLSDIEIQTKAMLAQKVNDTYMRTQKQSDYMYCIKHRKIGDAFPWRAKTQNYNAQCFVCYSPSNPNFQNSNNKANSAHIDATLSVVPSSVGIMPHKQTSAHRKSRDRKRCADTMYEIPADEDDQKS